MLCRSEACSEIWGRGSSFQGVEDGKIAIRGGLRDLIVPWECEGIRATLLKSKHVVGADRKEMVDW